MSESSSNATSPSNSSRPSARSMGRSGSSRSIFRDGRSQRSRQNTVDLFGFDDHSRNLGSDYQEIQIRTLNKWVNTQLKQVGESITNIKQDLRDGKKLLKLLSVLSNEPAPKPEKMNMRIHQLSNVAQALSFLEKQVGSDSMPDIGNEAIVNGDAKKTIALIFFIMLKYQIHLIVTEHGDDFLQSLAELSERENGVKTTTSDFSMDKAPDTPLPFVSSRKVASSNSIADKLHTSTSAEAKVALLYWVRIQLEDYISANIIPSIQDFSRSWRSGLAFCLLIHRHNPVYIPDLFSVHLKTDMNERATWASLLRLAFGLASEQMGITSYLEPEDLVDVDYPHEPSVMMYVSEYYKVMSRYQNEEGAQAKHERAVKRKAAIVLASGGIPSSDSIPLLPPSMSPDRLETASPESIPVIEEPMLDPVKRIASPVPVPMPSARRKKKMAQRESTLREEEKAKIKQDLNNKLLMQLTGHLPRGVHPVLDQLLTIHDTVLSFIKMNTKTIDELPEEFVSSSAVSEYIDALEIIEEQVDSEQCHLDTAKNARDLLTSPPETADDTLIHLTDLQRTQVIKLYDMLVKEWDQFVDLLRTTKDDLTTVENALIDTEESTEQFKSRAEAILQELDGLMTELVSLAPRVDSDKVHPLEGSERVALEYTRRLEDFSERFDQFENTTWREFSKASRQLPRAVMHATAALSGNVTGKHERILTGLQSERKMCADFKRGLVIVDTTASIRNELVMIQSLMDNSKDKATTHEAIQSLEGKVAAVRSTIYNAREEYGDLLTEDPRFSTLFSDIQHQYETVSSWVDQVRVWFVEAERIQNWIVSRIDLIDQRNEEAVIDPLGTENLSWISIDTEQVCSDHQKLKREIERFNEDDMERLRAHVKSITTGESDLSPADASTIEITLNTLNMLTRLTNLLQARTRVLDVLQSRIQWEDALEAGIKWIVTKENELNTFLEDKARWSEHVYNTQNPKKLAEEVIQGLVSLENAIAAFDKGDFSATLDRYQEMEDLDLGNGIPSYLEIRQEEFEENFAKLMKYSAFIRKVVEQHLILNDVVNQYKRLVSEGEKLKSVISHGSEADEDTIGERVQSFKNNSSHWVTTLSRRVPFPQDANDETIQTMINDYSMSLAEVTEELEDLLSAHRESLSLQQRASLAYDDLLRITSWLDERLRAIQKFESDMIDGEDPIQVEQDILDHLSKEHDSISVRLAQIENNDMAKALDLVNQLENEIDQVNSVSVDRNTLISGIESLEESHHRLQEALEQRSREVNVLGARIVWESQVDQTHESVTEMARKLWDFAAKSAQYDVEGLNKQPLTVLQHQKTTSFVLLEQSVQQLSGELEFLQSDNAFDSLQYAYNELYGGDNHVTVIPNHIIEKQEKTKEEYDHLLQLLDYVAAMMNQHIALFELITSTSDVQSLGESLQEDVQTILRESEGVVDELINQRLGTFKDRIKQVMSAGDSIKNLPGDGLWFKDWRTQALVEPVEYNEQIQTLVQKKLDDIRRLNESMTDVFSTYEYMDNLKATLEVCQKESDDLHIWMEKSMSELSHSKIDVTGAHAKLSRDQISICKQENATLSTDFKQLEISKVDVLLNKLERLISDSTERSTTVTAEILRSSRSIQESLARNMLLVQQNLTNQSLVLETAEMRLDWESNMDQMKTALDTLNKELLNYISKKNKCVAQQDLISDDLISSLESERDGIEASFTQFKDSVFNSSQAQYEELKSLLLRLPLTKKIPPHFEERMETCVRDSKKLEDSLSWRLREIGLIKERCQLEMDIKSAMEQFEKSKKSVSQFVEMHRWNPNKLDKERDAQAWKREKEAFDMFKDSTLVEIKEKYKSLQEISNGLTPGFMSELHAKKIQVLCQAEDYVVADLEFARAVVDQGQAVSVFLENANDLEQLAEVLREGFLSDKNAESRLEEFKTKVTELKEGHAVFYPARTNEQDVPMPTKVKDKTMNSVVQDTMSTHIGRLDELVASLSTLFKSKEMLTKLQYMRNSFDRQSQACQTWIESRRGLLEKSVYILDDENLTLDINQLRDAVSEADSIQTAMEAQDNHFTLLQRYYEKYVTTFDQQGLLSENEKNDRLDEYDELTDQLETIHHSWDDLLLETTQISNALSMALLPAEINGRIRNLMDAFDKLSSQIEAVDASSVDDNQLSEWQKHIDYLESKEYDRLCAETDEYKHKINADVIDSLMNRLDEAGETVLKIRASLTNLYDTINANRLYKTHADNSVLFHKAEEKVKQSIKRVCNDYQLVTDKNTVNRNRHLKDLTDAHKGVKDEMSESQGFYDDSCSYYMGIKIQDMNTQETQAIQEKVELAWFTLQSDASELSIFVSRIFKWVDACGDLDKLLQQLETVKEEVQNSAQTSPNGNRTRKYEKQLSRILIEMDELSNTINNTTEMAEDELNKTHFVSQNGEVRAYAQTIQDILDKRRMEKEKAVLLEEFNTETNKLCKLVDDQLSYIRQQASTNPEHHLKKVDTIKLVINAYSAALTHIEEIYNDCKSKYDGVVSDQANKLVKTFQHSKSSVDESKKSVEKQLKELQDILAVENDYISSLKQLVQLIRFDKETNRSLSDLKTSVSKSHSRAMVHSRSARTRDLPELKDFVQRYDYIEQSINDFHDKCEELKSKLNRRINSTRTNAITRCVDRREDELNRRWIEVKASASDVRGRLETLKSCQAVTSKLAESFRYIDNLKERVEALQLSGKSVSVEEQELSELQQEINVTLAKKTRDIDNLLLSMSRSQIVSASTEEPIKVQRERLSTSIKELRELVKHRVEQAHTAGSITKFFGIIDQITELINYLSKIIEETSTQNAKVVGSKFNKSDLQSLLKKLVTAYKAKEPKISELINEAKLEAQKQFLDDNDRVAARLKKTLKEWKGTQTYLVSREKELQACIKELNHEFFTKLAMAKSVPRERHARRGSKEVAQPRPRRSSFRSSTVSTENKMSTTNHPRRARSPNPSQKYVPDPKNELDVQLGQIVNDSPFRMKVKKVPGQVGKYWFGDDHPRLVYCRILPSKMVMVRVGGGWVELSKFMKDHGHSDGLATKSDTGETQYLTVSTFNGPDNAPSFSVTTRSGSPMGPAVAPPIIRRGSGVSSSLTNRSSNSSTTSGQLHGDKFIQTDEEGKQFVSKLIKAGDSPKLAAKKRVV
ncbi:hypothetical protein K501DRAFT_259621 [Backusella circina FSU 941]|nr:hypothetical protein K501DRAFT_259621 [Backusella circina FSU 941]